MTGNAISKLKRRRLEFVSSKERGEEDAIAHEMAGPHLASATVMTEFAVGNLGDQSLTKAVAALKTNAAAIVGG
jgi:hypothetical protein